MRSHRINPKRGNSFLFFPSAQLCRFGYTVDRLVHVQCIQMDTPPVFGTGRALFSASVALFSVPFLPHLPVFGTGHPDTVPFLPHVTSTRTAIRF
jgi:hypothetical protein